MSACSATKGTVIAVDFGHWGGSVLRGCDVSKPADGIQLLREQGFTTAGTTKDGPAFVCRIGSSSFRAGTQYPTSGEDACVVTPPSNKSWSYWLAAAGSNVWTYSSLGAGSDVPKAGEVQLWTFASTDVSGSGSAGKPTFTPNDIRKGIATTPAPSKTAAHSSAAKTTAAPTKARNAKATVHQASPVVTKPPVSSNTTGAAVRTGTAASSSGQASGSASARPTATAPSAQSSSLGTAPSSLAETSSSVPAIIDVGTSPRASTPHKSSGSPWPLIAGLIVALALGGAAGWTTWQRRRAR